MKTLPFYQRLLTSALALLTLLLYAAPAISQTATPEPTCLIIAPAGLRLRVAPGETRVLAVLPRLGRVKPLGVNQQGTWLQVRADNRTGWVSNRTDLLRCGPEVQPLIVLTNAPTPVPPRGALMATAIAPNPTQTRRTPGATQPSAQANLAETTEPIDLSTDIDPVLTGGYQYIYSVSFGLTIHAPGGAGSDNDSVVFQTQLALEAIIDHNLITETVSAVHFTIYNADNQVVFTNVEREEPYCAFGGNQSPCPTLNLQGLAYWPGTGRPLVEGDYAVHAAAFASTGERLSAGWLDFRIAQSGGADDAASTSESPVAIDCPSAGATQLTVGTEAVVATQNEPLRMRAGAGYANAIITQLGPGETVAIIGGPACADDRWWWQVQNVAGETGWVVEGWDDVDPYYILPLDITPIEENAESAATDGAASASESEEAAIAETPAPPAEATDGCYSHDAARTFWAVGAVTPSGWTCLPGNQWEKAGEIRAGA